MVVHEYVRSLFTHGITPVRIGARYRFLEADSPAQFFLENNAVRMRYAIKLVENDVPAEDLLVLCVHDQDPVGNAELLSRWHYSESYELEGGVYHIWWILAKAAGS